MEKQEVEELVEGVELEMGKKKEINFNEKVIWRVKAKI